MKFLFALLLLFAQRPALASQSDRPAPAAGNGTVRATVSEDLSAERRKENLALDRDAYIQVVQNKLDTWNQMIEDIRSGKYQDKDLAKNTPPQELKTLARTLESDRKIVAKHLDRLKRAEDIRWDLERKRIEAHFDQMRSRFAKRLAD
jgi:hypothetical protein